MADGDGGSSNAQLALEREKWETEKAFRERELRLKEHEQRLSSWTNPLTVAVSVAALAWMGNVIATYWNGRLQRVLEQEKADQQRELEETKAEAERILEVIKTDDPEKAVVNLKFLLDAGLITSPNTVKKLHTYLANTPAGKGPALPAAGTRFNIEPSEALPKAAAAMLGNDLKAFIAYLDKVGFPTDTEQANVRVQQLPSPNAEYHSDEKVIVVDSRIVGDPYAVHREYMHHLLFASKPGNSWASAISGIENGLADYFSGRFAGNPVLGTAETARVLGLRNQSFIRRLDNDITYMPYRAGDQPHQYGEMWGGAFWDLSTKLNADLADRIVARARETMAWPVEEQRIDASFVSALLKATETLAGSARVTEVRAVLGRRKIPVAG
jgi:hypothetical protein